MSEILSGTARHPVPGGEVTLLGAVHSVTGAMTRVELGGARVLVDAGIAQGSEARGWSLPAEAQRVDAIVLTHAHNDHVGSLPALLDRGFSGPIFGTPATLEVARIVIADSMRLGDAPPSMRMHVLERFDSLARAVQYGRSFELRRGATLSATFREAGHIIGSSSVELRADGARVIVSGDLGRPDSPLLRDYHEDWERGRPVDLVVMESTYGDGEHRHSHDDVSGELERILKSAIARRGHVLVPAFAIGRTQTLLWHLNALVESKRIPCIPVAIDTPMGIEVTETYDRFSRLFDAEALARIARGDEPLEFTGMFAVRKGKQSARLRDHDGPLIVIAGSGMCTGGRIVGHLADLLPREETTVIFVGYQAMGTPGRRIMESRGGSVWLDGEDIPVRATIEVLSGLSAHADRRELARWLRAIPDVKRVALHHGEPEAQRALVDYLGSLPATLRA
jgi:metallo-beta-lactamase family protein